MWQELSVDERRVAIEVVAAYVRAAPDKQFRKNPANYLRDKRFNDAIVPHIASKKIGHNPFGSNGNIPDLAKRIREQTQTIGGEK